VWTGAGQDAGQGGLAFGSWPKHGWGTCFVYLSVTWFRSMTPQAQKPDWLLLVLGGGQGVGQDDGGL
jgi:hypothetical protein